MGEPLACLEVCQATQTSKFMQMSTGTISAMQSRLNDAGGYVDDEDDHDGDGDKGESEDYSRIQTCSGEFS